MNQILKYEEHSGFVIWGAQVIQHQENSLRSLGKQTQRPWLPARLSQAQKGVLSLAP
jgi:hypothetical protein